jgi:hypothetical protein
MFETGNFGDVHSRYSALISRFNYPDHPFFLSLESLRGLVKKAGFEILSWSTYSLMPQLLVRSARKKPKSKEQKASVSRSTICGWLGEAAQKPCALQLAISGASSVGACARDSDRRGTKSPALTMAAAPCSPAPSANESSQNAYP